MQAPHKRGDPRGADRVRSTFEAPADYYPDDAELLIIIDDAAKSVQESLQRELTLCGQTISLWQQLRPANGRKTDLKRLPLLPSVSKSRQTFGFQRAAAAAAFTEQPRDSQLDDDDDLGSDSEDLDESPSGTGLLAPEDELDDEDGMVILSPCTTSLHAGSSADRSPQSILMLPAGFSGED